MTSSPSRQLGSYPATTGSDAVPPRRRGRPRVSDEQKRRRNAERQRRFRARRTEELHRLRRLLSRGTTPAEPRDAERPARLVRDDITLDLSLLP